MSIIPLEIHGLEQWLGYIIGLLLGIVVQGEGRHFFVLMFQPLKDREKVIYDLNPLNHLDLRGLPLLLFTGWGWSRKKPVEPDYFPKSWIFHSLMPLAGTMAIMCLVGLLGSLYFLLHFAVFKAAAEASTLLAVANFLIPVPPMALGSALCAPFDTFTRNRTLIETFGIAVLTVSILIAYFMHWQFLREWVTAISTPVANWVLSLKI
jgi:hypothetical protein